jgi:arylsulfatase A
MKLINTHEWLERLGLVILCVGSMVNLGCKPRAEESLASNRPNLVFILIDDLGWKDVGCYGSQFYQTPHVDRIAREGMRFTQAYAAAPVCSPSRASILTGRYPARVHVTGIVPGQAEGLASEEITIAERLKTLGYATCHVGKWHLGRPGMYPEDQGFDINIGGTHAGMPPSYFYPEWRGKLDEPGAGDRLVRGVPLEGEPGDYLPDQLSRKACEFIETHKDQPFFLYLAHHTVHTPMEAKDPLIDFYRNRIRADDPQNNPIYGAMVHSMDESVGRVLETLDAQGLTDNTIVVFFSDNGGLSVYDAPNTPATSNAPLRAGKGYLYEGGIREPLLVRWPGIVKSGSTCDEPVSSVDFFPTLLELVGETSVPVNPIDGVSFVPFLTQSATLPQRELYWHYPHFDLDGPEPGGAIRQGDFKLIEFYTDGRLELYDLTEDIGETQDLAAQLPEKTRELRALLEQWRKSLGVTTDILD